MGARGKLVRSLVVAALCGAAMFSVSGCAIFGYAAAVMPPMPIKAAYKGLQGQSVGVMVWVDRGIRIDYPTIQLDVANEIQNKLEAAKKNDKEELKDTIFPVEPRSIARYQADHPEVEAMPITEVAAKLNVSRLIFVEINSFQTRPDAALDLYRGVVSGTIKVIAVDAAGKAKLVYQEDEVRTVFPTKAAPEGVPNSSDSKMYVGVLTLFTDDVAQRFFMHMPPDE